MIQLKRLLFLLLAIPLAGMAQPAFIVAGDSVSDSLCHQPMNMDSLPGVSLDFDEDGNWDVYYGYYADEGWDYYDREHFCSTATDVAVRADSLNDDLVSSFLAGELIHAPGEWKSATRLVLVHRWHDSAGGSGYYGHWSKNSLLYMGARIAHAPDTAYCWALLQMTHEYRLRLRGRACTCESPSIGVEDALAENALYWHLQEDAFWLGGLSGAETQVDLIDMYGRVLLSRPLQPSPAPAKLEVDVSPLPAGHYVAKVIAHDRVQALHWVKP